MWNYKKKAIAKHGSIWNNRLKPNVAIWHAQRLVAGAWIAPTLVSFESLRSLVYWGEKRACGEAHSCHSLLLSPPLYKTSSLIDFLLPLPLHLVFQTSSAPSALCFRGYGIFSLRFALAHYRISCNFCHRYNICFRFYCELRVTYDNCRFAC